MVLSNLEPKLVNGADYQTVLAQAPTSGSNQNSKALTATFLGSLQGYNLSTGNADDLPDKAIISTGRDLAATDVGTNNVLVNSTLEQAPLSLKVGDTIVVQNQQGQQKTLTIVGFWDFKAISSTPSGYMFADTQLIQAFGGSQTQTVIALKVDPEKVIELRKVLNRLVPSALVSNTADVTSSIDQLLNGLVSMLVAIASLALIAALVIIANAVALAMLERRREIGILKSVGYTSRAVLSTVVVENGLIGAIGALVAMLLVSVILGILTLATGVSFGFNVAFIVLIIAASAVVTMIIAALVAWSATRVRPVAVLRYE